MSNLQYTLLLLSLGALWLVAIAIWLYRQRRRTRSIGSRRRRPRALENPILFAPWLLMRGDNDGLVPAESQRWGTVWMEVEHDHWGQVGWSVWRESRSLYLQILKELALRGG